MTPPPSPTRHEGEEAVKYRRLVVTYARRFLGWDEAEDIAQTVMFRVWRNFDASRPKGLINYTMVAARRAVIDEIRRRRRSETLPIVEAAHVPEEVRAVDRDLAWRCADADPWMFMLPRGEYRQVAKTLGMSRGGFKSKVLRARARERELAG